MRHLKKEEHVSQVKRFRQQVLGEKSTKDMEEMPTNFTTGFFLKENEILSEYSPVSRSDFR